MSKSVPGFQKPGFAKSVASQRQFAEGAGPSEAEFAPKAPPKIQIDTDTYTSNSRMRAGHNSDRHDRATPDWGMPLGNVGGADCGSHRVHYGLGSVRSDRYSIDCVTAVSMPDMRMTLKVLTV